MKKYWVYVLYSRSIDKFYIGYTVDISSRLEQHLQHIFKGSFTDRANDWEIYFLLECIHENQAILIEKHVKKNKSRKYIENLKLYPEISTKLLEKYG